MKKVMVYTTIVLAAVFFSTIDSLFDNAAVQYIGIATLIMVILDFVFVSKTDLEAIFPQETARK